VHAACWSHARRYFVDAVKLNKQDAASIRAVELINELFAIDAQARNENMDYAVRHALRREKAPPLLARIRTHIQEMSKTVLPKSAAGESFLIETPAAAARDQFLACDCASLKAGLVLRGEFPGYRARTRGQAMKRKGFEAVCIVLAAGFFVVGCGDPHMDPNAGAPPPTKVEKAEDRNLFEVERPERFPLVAAVEHVSRSELKATGTINPDILRSVPVISIATGRVVEIKARIGDTVKKDQLLMRVQSADIASAFSDYQKAVADERLSHTQLDRARDLYQKGAISLNDLQVAEDTDAKAKVDVKTTAEKLRVLGNTNLDQPSGIVEIRAPISGVITDQQVTNAAGVAGLGSPNPFTISDLSYVWILCDVYENDLSFVHLGEKADVRLNAYPDKVFTGTIGNIGAVLDPNLRTSKVRIEVKNPGLMRPGMFVTATFHGQKKEPHAAVPATAIVHLHDRDWVYVPTSEKKKFRRIEVKGGQMLPGDMQEVLAGVAVGQQVVGNALELQNTVQQ
jgi:membrane fusion protein, heavy metal efflux system